MTRAPVDSSNIAAIAYDPETQTLEVEFKPNRDGVAAVWQYAGVEREIYDEMLQPDNSVGHVFALRVWRNEAVTAIHIEDAVGRVTEGLGL